MVYLSVVVTVLRVFTAEVGRQGATSIERPIFLPFQAAAKAHCPSPLCVNIEDLQPYHFCFTLHSTATGFDTDLPLYLCFPTLFYFPQPSTTLPTFSSVFLSALPFFWLNDVFVGIVDKDCVIFLLPVFLPFNLFLDDTTLFNYFVYFRSF